MIGIGDALRSGVTFLLGVSRSSGQGVGDAPYGIRSTGFKYLYPE